MSIFFMVKQKLRSLVVAEPLGEGPFNHDWTTRIDSVPGWLARNEALLLWELSSRVNPANMIVEIGSYEGRSTVALATGSSGAKVFGVDPHTGDRSQVEQGLTVDTWKSFQANLTRCGVANIVVAIRDTSVSAADKYTGPPVELLFIDGWHSREAVKVDIRVWRRHLAPQASVVIDDWNSPSVAAGILDSQHLLPAMVGAVGKVLVFSSNPHIRHLETILAAKRSTLLSNPLLVMERLTLSDDS